MQFHNFAEAMFGSRVKIRLLRHLLAEGSLSGEREVAKLLGVSHSAVNKVLDEFYELNLVKPARAGNVRLWHLNEESFAFQLLKGSFSDSIKVSPVEHLKDTVNGMLGHLGSVKRATIFGSIAEGRELPNSDIDLFILVGGEEDRKDILRSVADLEEKCLRLYGNKLSAHIFTLKDLTNPKNKGFLENVDKGMAVKK